MSNKLFAGLVFCCTGIPSRKREEISEKTTNLGGKHYSDLMSDVNYLIVGNRNTDKYNYCLKHRHDIKFLKTTAVNEIYDRWLKGEEDINIDEYLLPIFSEISVCLSRIEIRRILQYFGDDTFRKKWYQEDFFDVNSIVHQINNNGGKVTESLTMSNTCVITTETEGRRYSKAIEWKIPVLHPIWIFDSLLRTAALKFDDYSLGLNEFHGCSVWSELLEMPDQKKDQSKQIVQQQRIKVKKNSDIWNSIMSEAKVQKHKKIKDSVWDDLLEEENQNKREKQHIAEEIRRERASPLFLGLFFILLGFTEEQNNLITKAIESHSGVVASQNNSAVTHVILPVSHGSQSSLLLKDISVALRHRIKAGEVKVVTEWFIERSMYYKNTCYDHWGQPIKGLNKSKKRFKICISGFTGIELLHIEKLIKNLNFEFCDSLSSSRDLLVVNINLFKDALLKNSPILFDYKYKDILDCPVYNSGSSSVALISTRNKINAAKKWNIPVVSISYLWEILELSKDTSDVIMPSVVKYTWCLFAPNSQSAQKSLSVAESDNSNPDSNASIKRVSESDNDLLAINSGMSLPSPRKAAKKQKYGRLIKPSKQSTLTKRLEKAEKDDLQEAHIPNNLNIDDEELLTQVGYENAESSKNNEELIRKLSARDLKSKVSARKL